jgi:hypothetical protein
MAKLVWNGCDNYIEVENLRIGQDGWNGKTMNTPRESFTPFEAVEVSIETVPLLDIETGERDFDGFFLTESGRVYREV